MTRQYNIFITVLFVLVISMGLAAHLLMPDRAFSQVENRYLAQRPALTLKSVSDGSFMTDFESYTTDQFPARDLWVAAKAQSERLSGKRENNGVYFAQNDTLINRVDDPAEGFLAQAAGYVNALRAQAEIPVYCGIIPTAAQVWSGRLPAGAPTADEAALIAELYGHLDTETVDILGALSAHSGEEIYYRTDHHWTSLGAYYGYAAIMEAMGISPVSLDGYEKTTVSEDFYGTTYSTSGVRWVSPDRIDTYVPEDGITVTSWFTGSPEAGRLYVPEYLEKKDQYSYFLGGVQPICVLENGQAEGGKLLVIRDSYSDCLAPFLAQSFSEVHLLDLRYYNAGVSRYLEEQEIDCVLVLYSLSNFISETNLFKLGM